MNSYLFAKLCGGRGFGVRCPHRDSPGRAPTLGLQRGKRAAAAAVQCGMWLAVVVIGGAGFGAASQALAARAYAAPAPEVEYTYDVMVRRHYNFATSGDAVQYGYSICEKVSRGQGYAQLMGDVKRDVMPNDEFAANYLVSYAVNLLCPAEIWQLRNSAAGYEPPSG